jgi:hypothetical protein
MAENCPARPIITTHKICSFPKRLNIQTRRNAGFFAPDCAEIIVFCPFSVRNLPKNARKLPVSCAVLRVLRQRNFYGISPYFSAQYQKTAQKNCHHPTRAAKKGRLKTRRRPFFSAKTLSDGLKPNGQTAERMPAAEPQTGKCVVKRRLAGKAAELFNIRPV